MHMVGIGGALGLRGGLGLLRGRQREVAVGGEHQGARPARRADRERTASGNDSAVSCRPGGDIDDGIAIEDDVLVCQDRGADVDQRHRCRWRGSRSGGRGIGAGAASGSR